VPTVVTENCQKCRFTECVTVCPVACFHGDDDMLYIDQDLCIDCKACVAICPVGAIVDADELPPDQEFWSALNAERARELPSVTEKCDPLPTAAARRLELGK
jgi:ferredoxin